MLLRDIKTLLDQGTSNHKVVVVDMDADTTQTLTDVLLSKGYRIVKTTTGPDSVKQAIALKPNMLVVDSAISSEHEQVKALRFENGSDNVLFFTVEHIKTSQRSSQPSNV